MFVSVVCFSFLSFKEENKKKEGLINLWFMELRIIWLLKGFSGRYKRTASAWNRWSEIVRACIYIITFIQTCHKIVYSIISVAKFWLWKLWQLTRRLIHSYSWIQLKNTFIWAFIIKFMPSFLLHSQCLYSRILKHFHYGIHRKNGYCSAICRDNIQLIFVYIFLNR